MLQIIIYVFGVGKSIHRGINGTHVGFTKDHEVKIDMLLIKMFVIGSANSFIGLKNKFMQLIKHAGCKQVLVQARNVLLKSKLAILFQFYKY